MHDYSGHEEIAAPEQQEQLNNLAGQLDQVQLEIEEIEARLKEVNEKRRRLRENDIPELMQSMGIKLIVTTSGLKIQLREEVRASFPKDHTKREAAFDWLREHNHDGLIKQSFVIQFSRDQEKLAEKFRRDLEKRKIPLNIDHKKDLNHQTMLAFLREQQREGEDVPLPLFGAFVQKFADVSRDKM